MSTAKVVILNQKANRRPNQEELENKQKKYECPILQTIFEDPVETKHGFYFERQAIIDWINQSGTCPLTREQKKGL
ncbi:u-box domain-containing protein [Stylonychia lemnae]|uniref:U-box domain-containing protein n=1 Tax=Stylonychia lemnae TaxID=5949 RepID=A0A078AJ97_STYLE|nr:u-box domain-containing protein [Stylonychia lemnae]|eukprot:CDW81567.1 u-box domain-containing protein [Stylonychia lemnae]